MSVQFRAHLWDWAKHRAYEAEHRADQLLERAGERRAAARLNGTAIDRDYLRGRGCHCPAGLARHYVHTEGLREGCDVVVDFGSNVEHRERRQVPLDMLRDLGRQFRWGDSVHVKADLLPWFAERVLPDVTVPIVLVTGDSDQSVVQEFGSILETSAVGHWFAQNCDVAWRHPKLTRIPIGLDNPIFTKLIKRLGFALHMLLGRTKPDLTFLRNDIGDQRLLDRVAAGMPALREKPTRALYTFQHNSKLSPNIADIPDRLDAFTHLRINPACWSPVRRLRQEEYWDSHRSFAFEVAPRGNGLDCFRTWECLALGTVPILKRSTLDPLFLDEGLPVVLVDSWEEVTAGNLTDWHRGLQDGFDEGMLRRLTNDYWLGKIRAAQAELR